MSQTPTIRPAPVFVGEHLALDFLNSTATPPGQRIEWLADGADLVDWLKSAAVIDAAVATAFRRESGRRRNLDAVAEQARSLREWLRAFVQRHAGRELHAEAVGELVVLNRMLAGADSHFQVEAAVAEEQGGGGYDRPLMLRRVRRWTEPEQLLHPIAEAIGDLVTNVDFRLIRTCEGQGCTLMFLDTTKSHARRWCSMAACGNRAKVAAHRARTRGRPA